MVLGIRTHWRSRLFRREDSTRVLEALRSFESARMSICIPFKLPKGSQMRMRDHSIPFSSTHEYHSIRSWSGFGVGVQRAADYPRGGAGWKPRTWHTLEVVVKQSRIDVCVCVACSCVLHRPPPRMRCLRGKHPSRVLEPVGSGYRGVRLVRVAA